MTTPPAAIATAQDAAAAALEAARGQKLAADPAASVWVAASAGTGKTSVLTNRVLALLLEGTAPERILALTFTKAAAAEMAARIAEHLSTWTDMPETELTPALAALLGHDPDKAETMRARTLFARVLDAPGGMPIQTIHAFCQSLLRRFPLEAGIAPHFSVMDERDAGEMLAQAQEDVLSRARAETGDGALRAALAAVTRHVNEDSFAELMAALASDRARLARMVANFGAIDKAAAAVRDVLGLKANETPETILAAACADKAFDGQALKQAARALMATDNSDTPRGAMILQWLDLDPDARVAAFPDYSNVFLTFSKEPPAIRKNLATKETKKNDPAASDVLAAEAARLLDVVMRRRAAETALATAGLLALAGALDKTYERAKRARALLDYDDLIHAAERLLAAQGDASWVLYKLDGGIDHVLIDEAQDTNPEQWRVVEKLAAEFFVGAGAHEEHVKAPRTMFAVGDVKQSIYSFQGADPRAFLDMRDRFAQKAANARRAWRTVDLSVSFRSVQAVLDAVDATFARPEAAAGVALDQQPIHHQAFRAGHAGVVELWPPVVPRPADDLPAWKPPVERVAGDSPSMRLARLIARRIERMIRTGEMLPARGRAIRAGDVMVLVRRRTAFVDALVRALKELSIPVAGVDRLVLTEHIAVMDLIALGRFLLLPEDDLTLATVLKSPLLGLSEDDLFRLAWNRPDAGRPGSLWRALNARADAGETFARRARDELAALLKRVDFVPPFELYADVLGPRRGREKLLARLGPDADDPITVFLDLALAFERGHPPSLEGFLHWLESGAVEVKRDLEQGGRDAVRIITVHGAKGLQAPVVFLPDTMQTPRQRPKFFWIGPDDEKGKGLAHEVLLWSPSRAFVDPVVEDLREKAATASEREYRRLLYVAMTRAEDRLYICGWQTKNAPPTGNWYDLVRAGIEGRAETVEDLFLAKEGVTEGATVLRMAPAQTEQAKPDKETITADGPLAPLPPWVLTPPPPEPTPPRVLAPSRPVGEEPAPRSPLDADQGSAGQGNAGQGNAGRGGRFRRGTLIHRLLQHLPMVSPEWRAEAARRWLAFAAGDMSEDIRAQYAVEALAVVDNLAFAHLFGPGSRAEVPIIGRVGPVVVAGQVDRLCVAADRISILDYKTHRPPPARESDVPEIYLRQMALYRALLAGAFPGRAVTCALLWTDGPGIMALSDANLDRFAPES